MVDDAFPDFDRLRYLIDHSPEEVERIFRGNIELIFKKASENELRRLRGLQFQIDAQKRLAKSPMDCCVRMSRMMHDSFIELNDALNKDIHQQ